MFLVRQFVDFWEELLGGERLHRGLPGGGRGHRFGGRRTAADIGRGRIFSHWRDALTRAFVADGFDESDAASLAIMCIASLEGAVVLCRSTRSADPLRDVAAQVEFLIKSREFVRRHGLPTVDR